MLRLIYIRRSWLTMLHCTKGTIAGTLVTHDHEGGCASVETLVEIRAFGLSANGDNTQVLERIGSVDKTR